VNRRLAELSGENEKQVEDLANDTREVLRYIKNGGSLAHLGGGRDPELVKYLGAYESSLRREERIQLLRDESRVIPRSVPAPTFTEADDEKIMDLGEQIKNLEDKIRASTGALEKSEEVLRREIVDAEKLLLEKQRQLRVESNAIDREKLTNVVNFLKSFKEEVDAVIAGSMRIENENLEKLLDPPKNSTSKPKLSRPKYSSFDDMGRVVSSGLERIDPHLK
jgi:hypothetical protein